MKITPIDIQQQQFKGKMIGGLDPDDVDSFLQAVAAEMEDLIRENEGLKEELSIRTREADDSGEKEKSFRETMLAAHAVIGEMKQNAEKQAMLIIAEAELNAERLIVDSEQRLAQIKADIEEARRQKIQFETSFKALLESHSRMLNVNEQS